ncbi:MAG TPA: hypothetical protein VMM15_42065 [Bradyrhizobium sp.]|nr:hypothetical protein [Bradyrhizobium sp.]
MNLADSPATTERTLTVNGKAVAMRRRATPGSTRELRGFAVLVLIGQVVLFLALMDRDVELATYVEVHLVCCLVLMSWLAWLGRRDHRGLAALQIVGWSAIAGPFGAFVALALTLRRLVAATEAQIGPEAAADRSTIARMHTVLLDRRARFQDVCRVRPLNDVIVEGSRSEKLEALSVAYRKYEARLGVLLRRALGDHDTSVRVLAATVIARLNATYGRKIGDCQETVGSKPDVAHHWRQLAEARLAYAESGLLEGARARAQIECAVGELFRAAELDPADAACARSLTRARRLRARGGSA